MLDHPFPNRKNLDRVILFTRYPVTGKVKTRLIPALGPEGSCALHREMTENTVQTLRDLSSDYPLSIEVRFEGGNGALMEAWLGRDLVFSSQGQGDLGIRMDRAFQEAFRNGNRKVVLIGSDCPGLTPALLQEAFESLSGNDLVLGPCLDGGYYLIGLSLQKAPVFSDISWGGNEVFNRTREKAEAQGLKVAVLERLTDIDRPEDLAGLETRKAVDFPPLPPISIIIPTLNEAATIQWVLEKIPADPHFEIIVVDGGSQDGTPELAEALGARVIASPPGRARQMNTGASQAKGQIFLFLHGDTFLPMDFDDHIRSILGRPGISAGAFSLRMEPPLPGLKLIEWLANWRARVFQLPYGDQAIFLRSEQFQALGGFSEIPILEDVELVHRLRRRGRIILAPVPVITSSRRWQQIGVWKTTLINQATYLAYRAGFSPTRLAHWYHRRHRRSIS